MLKRVEIHGETDTWILADPHVLALLQRESEDLSLSPATVLAGMIALWAHKVRWRNEH